MGNWQARAYGLPRQEHVSSVVQIYKVHPLPDVARRAMVEHLRSAGEQSWGAAMRHLGEDESKYISHYRRSELLFAAADSFSYGATSVEFEQTRYELFEHIDPVGNGA